MVRARKLGGNEMGPKGGDGGGCSHGVKLPWGRENGGLGFDWGGEAVRGGGEPAIVGRGGKSRSVKHDGGSPV